MFCKPADERARQRYLAVFGPLMGVYVLLVVVISWVFPISGLPDGLRHAAALTPVLPIAGTIWAMGRYLAEQKDEFARMLEARSMLAATGLLMVLATGWGFLEEYAGLAPFPVIILFPVWCGLWILTSLWAARKYQ